MRRWTPRRLALVDLDPRAVALVVSVVLGLAASLALAAYLWPAAAQRIVSTQMEPAAVQATAPPVPTARASIVPDVPPSGTGEALGSSRGILATLPSARAPVVPAVASAMPVLHGVVVRGELAVAYLEDPATKQVKGYRIGDSIAGSTVQAITADRVVLAHAGGRVTARIGQMAQPDRAASPTVAPPTAGAHPTAGHPADGNQSVVARPAQASEERLAPARRRMLLEAWLAAKRGDIVQAP